MLKALGNRLRLVRLSRGLSQIECSEYVDMTVYKWRVFEQGKQLPDLKDLIKVSKTFKVSLDYLVGTLSNGSTEDLQELFDSKYRPVSLDSVELNEGEKLAVIEFIRVLRMEKEK